MLSEKYIEKQQKYYKIYEFFYKFRVYFIILLAALVAISGTLMGIKGIVINDIVVSDVNYGSKLEYKSKAIFGNIDYYEFRTSNSETWTRNEPKLVGNYYLRGVSKSLFGNLRYGKEQAFTINPLSIELEPGNASEYGSKLNIITSLQYDDFISNCDYEIVSATSQSTTYNCKIDQNTFKIINNSGTDVTSCYKINFKDTYEFPFTSRSITISSIYNGVYDGTEQKSTEIQIRQGELVKNDYIKIDSQDSYIYAGIHMNKPKVKIYNSNNVDVTSLYSVSYYGDSYITISKRPITISTLDFSREYDGTSSAYQANYSIKEGSFVNGDTLHIFTPYQEDVGTYSNLGEYYITSKNHVNVTDSYDITFITGNYTITPKKANIAIFASSKEYNGEWGDTYSYNSSGLITDHFAKLESSKDYAYANTYPNHEVNVSILNSNSKDVTKNYELTIKYSNGFTITKRPITIKSNSLETTYDGNYKHCDEFEITSGSLVIGDTISVTNYSQYKEVGTYKNNLVYKITSSVLGDVTSCYNITFEYGSIIINERIDDDNDEEQSDEPYHVFYYDAKTSGKVFIVDGINYGNYNGKTYDKLDGYTIDSSCDYNPEEFIYSVLFGKAKIAEGTIILPENKSRTSDMYLNYPKFDRRQKKDTKVQISDLYSSTYNVKGLHYDYMKNPELIENAITYEKFNKAEADYRKYVKENYTGIDSYTYNYLVNYIKEYNLAGNSIKEIASNLINHIKTYFKYSIYPDEIKAKDLEHPFVSFLRDVKIGKCDYFATFGALVFRTLGYAARMITGYSTGGNAIKKYDVMSNQAHAICQVYIDGKGWVDFEFTVAENLHPGEGNSIDEINDEYYDIKISSEGNSMTYDGEYHKFDHLQITSYIKNIKVEKYFNEGYKKAGKYINKFEVVVYDSSGNLIDENIYVIKKLYGEITIKQKEIDIDNLSFNASLNNLSSNLLSKTIENNSSLAKGDKIEQFMILDSNPGKEVGKTYNYSAFITKITNKNGEDVTNCYKRKIINLNVTYTN